MPQADTSLTEVQAKRFQADDPELLAHLEEHGFAVVCDVLSLSELQQAESLLWKFLSEQAGWKQGSPNTWTDESFGKIGQLHRGLVNGRGVGQSAASWFVRTRKTVRSVFAHIWRDDDLITSFDGVNVFRPWHHGFQKTSGGWFHVDQGRTMRNLQCVQGFVSLTNQGADTGGLVVIPGSHKHHDEVCQLAEDDQDYIEPSPNHPLLAMPKRLVACRAGDLVLWDSRCLHCNSPALVEPSAPVDKLLRAVIYVCMTPRAWSSAEDLSIRRQGYEINVTTSHWPHRNIRGFGWAKAPKLLYNEAEADRQALI